MPKRSGAHPKYSYTSHKMGLFARLQDLWNLYQMHFLASDSYVEDRLRELRSDIDEMHARLNFHAIGKRILEIGPGPFLTQARYFALLNEVSAIDTDVILDDLKILQLRQLIRQNGMLRALKTIVRKSLGIDRRRRNILRRQLAVDLLPHVQIVHGNVCDMTFAPSSFDLVYSRGVLHFVNAPERALHEIARVLRPGGVAFMRLHLYTSHNGSMDSRLTIGHERRLYWGHLRGLQMRPHASLNKLRLDDWHELFTTAWPGCLIKTIETNDRHVVEEADRLIAHGELAEYTREELVTSTVLSMWEKA